MEFWKHRRQTPLLDAPEAHAEEIRGDVRTEPSTAAVRAAFEKGKREGQLAERRRHRAHPIFAAVVGAAALVGAGALVLAAHEGSFSGGGQVVDRNISAAASQAGQAVQNAGSAIGKVGPATPSKSQG